MQKDLCDSRPSFLKNKSKYTNTNELHAGTQTKHWKNTSLDHVYFQIENKGPPNENTYTIFQNPRWGSKDFLESLGFVHQICDM